MTRLSVNVNKVAVLRNSRGGVLPDVCRAASVAMAAGAGGITVHPRPDLRHITPSDVLALTQLLQAHPGVEFNIEGNPFAPASASYPGILELTRQTSPAQVTLVPDGDAQITSDHGWALDANASRLKTMIAAITPFAGRVSLFVDADCLDLAIAADVGAAAVEIYTGPFARAFEAGDYQQALDQCAALCARAKQCGLMVHAGHDLNQQNLPVLLRAAPDIAEVSIGHALFDDAIYAGLAHTVRAYLHAIKGR
jgi:pyridoxine 5-phosphate synthase